MTDASQHAPRARVPARRDHDRGVPRGPADLVPRRLRQAIASHTIREEDVRTPDGRALRVRHAGLEDGFPVFVHHGTPSAGLLWHRWIDDAVDKGLRLIAYDRPGYGGSDPHPGRRAADAAGDVATIADRLGIDRFATWGWSGGGPHALACAALLQGRCAAAALLAGCAPSDQPDIDWMAGMGEDNVVEFSAALKGREALEPLLRQMAAELLAAPPEELFKAIESLVSEGDKAALRSGLGEFLHSCDEISLGKGIEGWVEDDLAFATSWGFDVGSIECPVLIFQGREDRMVPYAHGEWLAAHIPGVEARLSDHDGHLTLAVDRVSETHEWLRGTRPA